MEEQIIINEEILNLSIDSINENINNNFDNLNDTIINLSENLENLENTETYDYETLEIVLEKIAINTEMTLYLNVVMTIMLLFIIISTIVSRWVK